MQDFKKPNRIMEPDMTALLECDRVFHCFYACIKLRHRLLVSLRSDN